MKLSLLQHYFRNPYNFDNVPSGYNLKRYYGVASNYRLRVQKVSFSILTQNMALMVAPGKYCGANSREDVIAEIVYQIKTISPDVVGLCEVFDNDERANIWNALKPTYPYAQAGPDGWAPFSDGGLLVISKHPFLQTHQHVYDADSGVDAMAYKGIIYVSIQPPGFVNPIDLFYTHAQNLDVDNADGYEDRKEALFNQLREMAQVVHEQNVFTSPAFIFGDINVPGDNSALLNEMLNTLNNPVDLWLLAGNNHRDGCTNVRDNNFYSSMLMEDMLPDGVDDRIPQVDHRLDFILMKANPAFVPILEQIKVMKFMKNGRNLSDHFGLYASFNELLHVQTF